jgi:methyltransferase (TIGR00027 family)
MEAGKPSRTALGAAMHRARHQVHDGGRIFSDPLALRILSPEARERAITDPDEAPNRRRLRLFIAMRSRIAEDRLAAAVAKGLAQLVVLGAGLDTFAYRNPFPDRLRVFEVDHPATQAWKRERLAAASIDVPATLTFAPVDFERETLAEGLAAAGFDRARPAFFTWLGVVPYLSEEAVVATLTYIASHPGGAHVVFDYGNRPSEPSELAERVAKIGEEFRSYYDTAALHATLARLGLHVVEDVGERGHVVYAGTVA